MKLETSREPYVFVQTSIFLRYWLEPDDFTGGEPHDDIHMVRGLGNLVNVMTETMSLGEQNLG